MDPVAQRFLIWAAVLFVVAGLFIAVAERASGRPAGRIWTSYAVQFAIVGYILVPVALGRPWYAAAIVLLTVQTTREMLPVLRARGLSPLAAAAHLAAAGCLGLAWAEQRLWLVVALALLGGALLAFVARRGDPRAADAMRLCWRSCSPGGVWPGLFSFLMPGLSLGECLVSGAAIGILGQAADLAASAVKRWAGVKDYGALVPTHGGVLDVYDSFILTGPAVPGLLMVPMRAAPEVIG